MKHPDATNRAPKSFHRLDAISEADPVDERRPPPPEPNPTSHSRKNAGRVQPSLLETCSLHAVLDLPGGVFTGAGVKTVVLFFNTGEATKKDLAELQN